MKADALGRLLRGFRPCSLPLDGYHAWRGPRPTVLDRLIAARHVRARVVESIGLPRCGLKDFDSA